jgi:hypothetical protein
MRHPLYRVSNVADLDNSKEALFSAKKRRRNDARKEIIHEEKQRDITIEMGGWYFRCRRIEKLSCLSKCGSRLYPSSYGCRTILATTEGHG